VGNEVHGDKDLALEIANAYVRVAHAQGDPTSPNLGQFAEAEATLDKAERLVQSVLTVEGGKGPGVGISAGIAHDRMLLANAQGRRAETLAWAREAETRVEHSLRLMRLDHLDPHSYGLAYWQGNVAGLFADSRRFDDALRAGQRALEIAPQRSDRGQDLRGPILAVVAQALWQMGNLDQAFKNSSEGIGIAAKDAASGHVPLRLDLAEELWSEGMLLGKEDAEPSLGRTADALADFRKALSISEDLAGKDPDDFLSHEQAAKIGLEIGNIVRHSDPKKALPVYDHALARLREVKANAFGRKLEVALLAGSSYAARWSGHGQDARQRLDTAFQLLREDHRYPADKVEPLSEIDYALRARADEYVETGQTAKALAAYQSLLDALMAWKPDLENDLRDATCIARTWTEMTALLRQAGRKNEADRLEAQRADLFNHWKSKLPNGEFLLRQSFRQTLHRTPFPSESLPRAVSTNAPSAGWKP
jgi:tetratricopeptide (TPR) repeat protein